MPRPIVRGSGSRMRAARRALSLSRILFLLSRARNARRGVEELLEEGELAALGGRRSCLERDDMSVPQAVVLQVCDLAVFVEIDREDRARLDGGREERHGLLDARDIVPGVVSGRGLAKGRLGRGIAEPLLDA